MQSPNFEPQEIIKIWVLFIEITPWLLNAKKTVWLVLRVGSNFLFDTSPKPHLQKVLTCRHPCHNWDLRLGTACEVKSPTFHAINDWDCTDWPEVTWDLGLGAMYEPALSVPHPIHLWLGQRARAWDIHAQLPWHPCNMNKLIPMQLEAN